MDLGPMYACDNCGYEYRPTLEGHDDSDCIKRLREENARLKEEARANDPASYSSMVYWREKCYEARAEVERLRDIISPGDAAAYEEGMAALEAKLARVVALCNTGHIEPESASLILAAAKGE